jgi:hypothetical protein
LFIEFPQGGVGPFGPLTILFLFGVFDKVFRVFVDTEIGQMHVSFLDILDFGIVLMGSESCQPLIEHVDS